MGRDDDNQDEEEDFTELRKMNLIVYCAHLAVKSKGGVQCMCVRAGMHR